MWVHLEENINPMLQKSRGPSLQNERNEEIWEIKTTDWVTVELARRIHVSATWSCPSKLVVAFAFMSACIQYTTCIHNHIHMHTLALARYSCRSLLHLSYSFYLIFHGSFMSNPPQGCITMIGRMYICPVCYILFIHPYEKMKSWINIKSSDYIR